MKIQCVKHCNKVIKMLWKAIESNSFLPQGLRKDSQDADAAWSSIQKWRAKIIWG